MLKKARKAINKIKPLAFLLFTLIITHMSATKQVVDRSIE
jgi:hypothetical protein